MINIIPTIKIGKGQSKYGEDQLRWPFWIHLYFLKKFYPSKFEYILLFIILNTPFS